MDPEIRNPNRIPITISRLAIIDQHNSSDGCVLKSTSVVEEASSTPPEGIQHSDLSRDQYFHELQLLELQKQAVVTEVEFLKKTEQTNLDLIAELKEAKKVQEQKLGAARIRQSDLLKLKEENRSLREDNEKLRAQNQRFRSDLVVFSNALNVLQVANRAAKNGDIGKKVVKYRKERDLARDKLKEFAREQGKDWRDWYTRTEQAAAIETDRGFNMYDHLKKRR